MIRAATTRKEHDALSTQLGIVVRGTCRNPFRWEASTDTVNDIPVDTFHQDAIVSSEQASSTLSALSSDVPRVTLRQCRKTFFE